MGSSRLWRGDLGSQAGGANAAWAPASKPGRLLLQTTGGGGSSKQPRDPTPFNVSGATASECGRRKPVLAGTP